MTSSHPTVARIEAVAAPTPWDWAAAALLAVACVAAPLALGATGAWPRFATEAAMGLATTIWALSAARSAWPSLLPIAIAALLMVQLLPLPDRMLALVSPVAVGAWKVALADDPTAWGRITVDPATTAAAIRRLLLAAATVFMVADLGTRMPVRRLLAGALAAVCITIWLLGLLFPFQRKEVMLLGLIDFKGPIAAEFWKTPIEPPIGTNGSGNLEWVTVGDQRYQSAMWIAADGFGPYIYANHFAAALCLTLPVLLGSWLAVTRRRIPNLARHAIVAVGFTAAVWTAGIPAASRAGAAGMLLAALAFASLTLERLWARRLATLLGAIYFCGMVAFVVVFYGNLQSVTTVVPEPLQSRLAAMLSDGRVLAARTALRMFLAAPVLGSGLGTFGELFPRFLRADFLLNYAHNDYAQWLAETGLAGAALAGGFICMLVGAFRRWWHTVLTRRQGDPLVAGIWAGLAGVSLHTAFDWNLHVPANALLACVAAGLALSSGAAEATAGIGRPASRRSFESRLPGFALSGACLLVVALLARDAASDAMQRNLRKAIVAARLVTAEEQKAAAANQLQTATGAAERLFPWDPGNGRLAVSIGLAEMHRAALPSAPGPGDQPIAGDEWFARARRLSATCRGLPEAVVKPRHVQAP